MSTPSPRTNNKATSVPPRPLAQRLGAILWPAFLMAGVGTMVLFGLYDPLDLARLLDPEWEISRHAGYAMGFFSLWCLTTATSTMTWLLLRARERLNGPTAH